MTAYKGFADMAASGKIPVKNLTGTLSIYAQALHATGNEDEANKVFEEVVKADPRRPMRTQVWLVARKPRVTGRMPSSDGPRSRTPPPSPILSGTKRSTNLL